MSLHLPLDAVRDAAQFLDGRVPAVSDACNKVRRKH
jgi:hypothetical protein